jgi:hypothetical protein
MCCGKCLWSMVAMVPLLGAGVWLATRALADVQAPDSPAAVTNPTTGSASETATKTAVEVDCCADPTCPPGCCPECPPDCPAPAATAKTSATNCQPCPFCP